jgi:hypothetical protein
MAHVGSGVVLMAFGLAVGLIAAEIEENEDLVNKMAGLINQFVNQNAIPEAIVEDNINALREAVGENTDKAKKYSALVLLTGGFLMKIGGTMIKHGAKAQEDELNAIQKNVKKEEMN